MFTLTSSSEYRRLKFPLSGGRIKRPPDTIYRTMISLAISPPEILETSLFATPTQDEWLPPPSWAQSISLEADIYALSITISELITGSKPFAEASEQDLERVFKVVAQGHRPTITLAQYETFLDSSTPSSPPVPSTLASQRQRKDVQGGARRRSAALNGLVRLVEMMWAQAPASRPSSNQVVERFEELAWLEEAVGD